MKYPTTEDVISAAMKAFNLTYAQLRVSTKKGGKRSVAKPRQAIHWKCKQMDTDCLEDIAIKTGVMNHATVLSSYHLFESQVPFWGDIAEYARKLEEALYYRGFNTGPSIRMAKMDYYNGQSLLPHNARQIKVTNAITGDSILAESMLFAEIRSGVNRKIIEEICYYQRPQQGYLEFSCHG